MTGRGHRTGRALLVARALLMALVGCRTGPPGLADEQPPTAKAAMAQSATLAPPNASSRGAADPLPESAMGVASAHAMSLVRVESDSPAASSTLPLVTLTHTELLVGSHHIADVTAGPLGFEAAIKRAGQRAALQVMPLDAALRALHGAEAPQTTTVRFLFDASTSYRAALEVLFTAAHAGFTEFDFVVVGGGGERALPASTPTEAEWQAAHTPGAIPPPSFVLDATGARVSVGTTTLGAGCVKGGDGITVASLDPERVAACGVRLHSLDPSWATLSVANVSATGGLDLQSVLAVVAGLIRTFPTIHFGMVSS